MSDKPVLSRAFAELWLCEEHKDTKFPNQITVRALTDYELEQYRSCKLTGPRGSAVMCENRASHWAVVPIEITLA